MYNCNREFGLLLGGVTVSIGSKGEEPGRGEVSSGRRGIAVTGKVPGEGVGYQFIKFSDGTRARWSTGSCGEVMAAN